MIAALPMYDLPGLKAANAAFWQAVAGGLRRAGIPGVPDGLTRPGDPLELWSDPGLLLAQACGLPFVTLLQNRVRFVATPVYDLPGCADGDYRSWIIVRDADKISTMAELRGRRAAVNAPHSQSGANALAWLTIPFAERRPFFARIIVTGAHLASINAVHSGLADCAAIDCVTWALVERTAPARLQGLRIIAAGPAAPALPFITSGATDAATVALLRQALADTIAEPGNTAVCQALGLAGIAPCDAGVYQRITALHEQALQGGCANLVTTMRRGM